eukprot:15441732-Alexandrium_andersonii.AAC.1
MSASLVGSEMCIRDRYFVDFQLMDFDNQKGLWRRSLSMRTGRPFIPVFKEETSDEATANNNMPEAPAWGQSPEDFVMSQANFDDS